MVTTVSPSTSVLYKDPTNLFTRVASSSDLTTTNLEPDDEYMWELVSKIVLREATPLDTRVWLGMTGLHWAAKYGRNKSVQELLERGRLWMLENAPPWSLPW